MQQKISRQMKLPKDMNHDDEFEKKSVTKRANEIRNHWKM